MKRTCEIKLVDFGSLKALASVTIDNMEIRGFKVIDSSADGPWVAPPSREILKEGRKEYFDIVRFPDKDARKEFQSWLLREYQNAAGGVTRE